MRNPFAGGGLGRGAGWLVLAILIPVLLAPGSARAAEFSTQRDVKEAFIRKLSSDIRKLDKSIEVTKNLIARSKTERYLPDLVFRLAELYVEKSRLVYFRILEEAGLDDKRSITAPEARLLKDAAIREYRRVLRDFPKFEDNDKIYFFIAHEQRELGQYEDMLKTYLTLVEKFPESDYRFEAWLIVGDYYFDKSDLDTAESYYKKVLAEAESYVHPMARFKLGWCYLNREKWKAALALFEKVVQVALEKGDPTKEIDSHKNVNVKREALTSLVYAYPEVKKAEQATEYFRALVANRAEYLLVLEKLARRYSVKQNYIAAGNLYRELLSLSHDVDRNIEFAQRVYDAVQASKKREHSDRDVALLTSAAARYRFSWRADQTEKDAVYSDFEQLTRDLATRLHVEAQRTESAALFMRSSRSYRDYLSLFIDAATRTEMRWNYAESLYESEQFVDAGREFEKLAQETDKEDERKKAMNSAINAYFAAIRQGKSLNRYEAAMAREGLKALGAAFVAAFPDDAEVPAVKFNIARAYYEQGEYDRAIELFVAFAREYPMHADGVTAAELALDSFNNKEDYDGMAKVARELSQLERLGDEAFRKSLLTRANDAEQQDIDKRTIEAGGDVQSALADIITEKKGTEIAAKALYQAFVVARDRRDTRTMYEVGQQILNDYGTSDFAKDILSSMGEGAIKAADFARGAAFYEEYARRFPADDAAADLLSAAAKLRTFLGDFAGAMTDYERLAKIGGADAARYFAEMAAAAEQSGEWRRVLLATSPILNDPSFGVEAKARAGEAMLRSGQESDAVGMLLQTVQEAPPGRVEGDQIGFAARAAFLLGEVLRTRYEAIQFGKGDDAAVLENKFGMLAEIENQYVLAIKYGHPEYAIGALYRLGFGYREAANFLEKAPSPDGVSPEELQAYRAALQEQANAYHASAKETLKTCREKVQQLNAFNRYARGCITEQPLMDEREGASPRQQVAVPGADALRVKIERNPKDMQSLVELARAANGAGDYYLAKLVASKALEISETNSLALNAFAVADIELGNYQAAYYSLEKAKESDSKNGAVSANLGALYYYIGDTKRARAAFRSAGGKLVAEDLAPSALKARAGLGG